MTETLTGGEIEMPEKECCGNCRFWRRDQWQRDDGGMVEDSVCRFNPTPLGKGEHDWCGQHKPKEETE